MNYNIGYNPFDPISKIVMLEQELMKTKEKIIYLEQKITKLEDDISKKNTPQYLNSNVGNDNGGLYML